jgi:hypothetical protein
MHFLLACRHQGTLATVLVYQLKLFCQTLVLFYSAMPNADPNEGEKIKHANSLLLVMLS